jgi:cytidyltransferase-like protein
VLVETPALAALRGAVTMVDGGFYPLHDGHIAYIRAAQDLGLPVLVNVAGDDYVSTKHPPLLPAATRARVIDALRGVDYVYISSGATATVLAELRPRFYVKGVDWEGRLPDGELGVCAQYDIEPVFVDTMINSSTDLLNRASRAATAEALLEFEQFVAHQKAPATDGFDSEYFVEDWREGANAYTVEARRPIEGKNPTLIREVFGARRVLDAGCGPGTLMFLLHEVGVHADGLDASPHVKDLAPPEVANRIRVGSVTDIPVEDEAYDLVVCREVLEHLTVLDVVRAVRELTRVSSRFIYVTTRFHPSPRSLFDVSDELDVDPTHITCLNQDLLRLMFVLNAFIRRPDLEVAMDWLDKRRVLVYERLPI